MHQTVSPAVQFCCAALFYVLNYRMTDCAKVQFKPPSITATADQILAFYQCTFLLLIGTATTVRLNVTQYQFTMTAYVTMCSHHDSSQIVEGASSAICIMSIILWDCHPLLSKVIICSDGCSSDRIFIMIHRTSDLCSQS